MGDVERAALAERWSGKGLSPMTEFEMAGAVYRDSLVVGLDAYGNIDAYDRRGLLNLVAALLDRLDAGNRDRQAAEEALRDLGFEYGVCDACHGEADDPREPGVVCAWCKGRGKRARSVLRETTPEKERTDG